MTKTFAIREAIRTTTLLGMPKIIVKCDFQMAIVSILGRSWALKQMRNLIEDTQFFANDLRESEFIHCNWIINKLADRLAKGSISTSPDFSFTKFPRVPL